MEYKVLATVLQQHKKSAPDMVGKCCWLMENEPRWIGDWYKWEHEPKNTSNKFRLDTLLKDGVHGIYCVKRLTDNVEFMIGDMINTYGKIEKIKIDSNGLFRAVFSGNRGVWRPLDEIPKNFHKDHQLIKNIESYQVLTVSLLNGTLLTYEGEKCISRTDKCPVHATKCLSNLLRESNVDIHSVKRLNDGKTFSVGDNILAQTIKLNQRCTIHNFKINDGKLKLIYTDSNHNNWESTIDKIEPYQPTESYRMDIMDFSLKKYGNVNLDKMAEALAGYSGSGKTMHFMKELPGLKGEPFELNLEQDWDAMREKMSNMFTDLDGNSNVEWIDKKLLLLL